MPHPREVFLSHATADRTFATSLAEFLRWHGIPLWYSRTELRGSQAWQDEIGEALERCDWFLCILSPAAVRSMWVKREVTYAMRQPRLNSRMVPLLFKTCRMEKLSWVIPTIQWIDFRKPNDETYRELLAIWGMGMKRRR